MSNAVSAKSFAYLDINDLCVLHDAYRAGASGLFSIINQPRCLEKTKELIQSECDRLFDLQRAIAVELASRKIENRHVFAVNARARILAECWMVTGRDEAPLLDFTETIAPAIALGKDSTEDVNVQEAQRLELLQYDAPVSEVVVH